jgi:hypothetical protein
MGGDNAERTEAAVDRIAAALLAGATAYAFFFLMSGVYPDPQLGVFSATAAVMAYLVGARSLGKVRPEPRRFDLPAFELPSMEHSEFDELLLTEADEFHDNELVLTEADEFHENELVLTDADRFAPPEFEGAGELVLQDILAELGPDSRVVRLFDPAAMPTPGQLNARIERHLGEGSSTATAPDASQALYDALTELRRSLR